MEAANPLCRLLLLAAALTALIGCQSGTGVKARGQVPQDPLAPIAPPLTPPPGASGSFTPIAPITPTAPAAPVPGAAPAPAGAVLPGTVLPGTAVPGSPVPPTAKGSAVINTSYAAVAKPPAPAELLKNGTPRVKVIAIVGRDNVITDQEVIESVWQRNDELSKLDGHAREAKQKELYTAALRKTIERELILDEMYAKLKKAGKMQVIDEIKEASIDATNKQIREMKKMIGCKTDDDLNVWLRVQGLTLPVFRRQFERQFMSQQYIGSMLREKGRKVGLGEIRDYYDKHPQEFKAPDRVKWQHVFVSLNKHATPQAALEHAEALLKQAAGGADFAALSKQHDDGVAGKQNGFGTGETRGDIQPADIESTVWALKPGQLSAVIQAPTGFHIVKVVEREYAGVLPFDAKLQGKIRDKLTDTFYDADAKKMIEDLWRKGVVEILPE